MNRLATVTASYNDKNLSRLELVMDLGYVNTSKGLRRFERFVDTGEPDSGICDRICQVLDIPRIELGDAAHAVRKCRNQERKIANRHEPYLEILSTCLPEPPLYNVCKEELG